MNGVSLRPMPKLYGGLQSHIIANDGFISRLMARATKPISQEAYISMDVFVDSGRGTEVHAFTRTSATKNGGHGYGPTSGDSPSHGPHDPKVGTRSVPTKHTDIIMDTDGRYSRTACPFVSFIRH